MIKIEGKEAIQKPNAIPNIKTGEPLNNIDALIQVKKLSKYYEWLKQ